MPTPQELARTAKPVDEEQWFEFLDELDAVSRRRQRRAEEPVPPAAAERTGTGHASATGTGHASGGEAVRAENRPASRRRARHNGALDGPEALGLRQRDRRGLVPSAGLAPRRDPTSRGERPPGSL